MVGGLGAFSTALRLASTTRPAANLRERAGEPLSAWLPKHDAFVGVSLAGMAERLGLMNRRLDGLRDDLLGGG